MTPQEVAPVLTRFHQALVEEILTRRPEYLEAPFTVAEIYQNLVPYGTHRDRIGVEMNGDYEDALLRLLSGEGDYLILDSEPALREMREELTSTNPNTGLFREFAAVDVRLNPAKNPAGAPAPPPEVPELRVDDPDESTPATPVDEPISVGDLAPAVPAEPEPRMPREAPVIQPMTERAEPTAAPVDTCRWCRAELPPRDNLNFCPFCGQDVHVIPCPECGEELDPDWRFCIACGAEVPA